jgi:HEAT repeat protein
VRRVIGRLVRVIIVVGAVVAVARWGATLGIAQARERVAFLPAPVTPLQMAEPRGMDSARVRAVLGAARGANAMVCEMAATTVDGRSGWWSDSEFRVGSSADSAARDVVSWVQRHEVEPNAVPILRSALGDPDWCVRRLAAPLLGRVRDASAHQAMLAALGSSDAGAREMAALAIGFADDSSAVQPLIARLRDGEARVRATAAWALGEIERHEAVRPLIDALGDADALVRESAAHALGEVEDTAAIPALADLLKSDRIPAVRRAAAKALGEIAG